MIYDPHYIAVRLILQEFCDLEHDDYMYCKYITYLVQKAGVDLGYHYGWFHRTSGVHSEKFADGFFGARRTSAGTNTLIPHAQQGIFKVKSLLMDQPSDITKLEWVNVLTNYHFLRTVSKFELKDTLQHISVARHAVDDADKSLKLHTFL